MDFVDLTAQLPFWNSQESLNSEQASANKFQILLVVVAATLWI
jgi:hypothetical protein